MISAIATCEFITIEEVAQRLHVSRATMFNWLQRGVFIQGKHYFKRGRVLRFVWGADLVNDLLTGKGEEPEKPHTRPAKAKKKSPLNWDY